MVSKIAELKLRSVDFKDSIDKEVACEGINLQLTEKIARLRDEKRFENITTDEMNELKALVSKRRAVLGL